MNKNSQKIELGSIDPFKLGKVTYTMTVEPWPLWPRVDDVDTINLLVLRTGCVTLQPLESRKSLGGHNSLMSGWFVNCG